VNCTSLAAEHCFQLGRESVEQILEGLLWAGRGLHRSTPPAGRSPCTTDIASPETTNAAATLPCRQVGPTRGDRGLTHDMTFWFQSLVAIVLRPWLWWTALRQAGRISRPRWWTRAPFLPVPDARYIRFRRETAYGEGGTPQARDLVRYLEWCRDAGDVRAPRRAS
jgi:hypothetical protein